MLRHLVRFLTRDASLLERSNFLETARILRANAQNNNNNNNNIRTLCCLQKFQLTVNSLAN